MPKLAVLPSKIVDKFAAHPKPPSSYLTTHFLHASMQSMIRASREDGRNVSKAPKPLKSVMSDKEPLQIRIPVAIKRQFKAHAAMRGMEPNQLFVEVWEHYERTNVHAQTKKT